LFISLAKTCCSLQQIQFSHWTLAYHSTGGHDTQHNDIQHNETQLKGTIYETQHM